MKNKVRGEVWLTLLVLGLGQTSAGLGMDKDQTENEKNTELFKQKLKQIGKLIKKIKY